MQNDFVGDNGDGTDDAQVPLHHRVSRRGLASLLFFDFVRHSPHSFDSTLCATTLCRSHITSTLAQARLVPYLDSRLSPGCLVFEVVILLSLSGLQLSREVTVMKELRWSERLSNPGASKCTKWLENAKS